MKKLMKWYNSKVKKLKWCDISLIKLSTFAFALMLAKLWPAILNLDWYWYLIIALLAAVKPLKKALKK
jgi:hypothetical protein